MRNKGKEECILPVRIKPSSKKFKIEVHGEMIRIHLKSPPVEGRANKELLKKLKDILKCKVEILRGETSHNKLLKIDKPCNDVMKLLNREGNA